MGGCTGIRMQEKKINFLFTARRRYSPALNNESAMENEKI